MFDNIGGKIKGLASFICWMGIIACVIAGIAMISSATQGRYTDEAMVWTGIGVGVLGSLLSWVSSFVLYGFGTLVENSEQLSLIASEMKKNKRAKAAPADTPRGEQTSSAQTVRREPGVKYDNDWICPKCGARNRSYCVVCPDCLTKKPAPGEDPKAE